MDFFELFAHVPATLVVLSPVPDYKILACTDAYLQVTMRKREDILGLAFLLEAFPDREISYEDNPVRKSLARAIARKQADYLEVLRYDLPKPEHEGGGYEVRYWEAFHTPVLDEAGNVKYVIQKTTDVTAREVAKEAQQASENKFRFMADAMPQLVFTMSPTGELTYLNQRWADYTGIALPEWVAAGWPSILHPDDQLLVAERWEDARRHGTEIQMEVRKQGHDGAYRWYLCRILPMRNSAGDLTMWLGSSTDIHATRQLVQELLDSNEQMADLSDQVREAYQQTESERKSLVRLIMEAPAMIAILKGPEHRFDLVNPNYQQLFPNRQLLNKTVAEALPEVVEQGFVQLLDNVYQTGETFTAKEILARLDRQNNGQLEEVYLNLIYQPIYGEAKIEGIITFGYDVTESVQLRQKLQAFGNYTHEITNATS